MQITIGRPLKSVETGSKDLPDSQQKLVPKAQSNEDQFDLNGIRIRGVSFESIETACLELRIPMKAGLYSFPGAFQNAETKIAEDTCAVAKVHLGKSDNRLKITEITISLSAPAVIENPASAFMKPKHGFWALATNAVADHFAKVEINGISVDSSGTVHLDGTLIKGGLLHTPLSELDEIELPRLNVDLRNLSQQSITEQEGKSFGRAFLKVLGNVARESDYVLDALIAPTKLKMDSDSLQFRTDQHALKAHAQGKFKFNENLDFSMNAERNRSFIESVLGKIFLGASFSIEHAFEDTSHLEMEIEGSINDLADIGLNGHKVSAKNVDFFASASAELKHASHDIAIHHGEGNIVLNIKNPKLKLPEGRFHLDGSIGTRLEFSEFEARRSDFNHSLKGNFTAYMQENRIFHTRSGKRHELELSFHLHRSGRLSTAVSQHISSDLLALPFENIYGHKNSLLDPFGVEAVQLISETEFRAAIQDATKSQIRSGNEVSLLVDGIQSYPRRLELIQNAEGSIWLQTLIFQDDVSGIATAQALAEAAKRGVRVCVIVDGQATAEETISANEENRSFQIMKEGGVELRLHNDKAVMGLRDILDVMVDNHLTHFSKQDLVKGPIIRLIALVASICLDVQQGQLMLAADQRAKLIRGINNGLGRAEDAPIDEEHPLLLANSKGSIDLAQLIECFQQIMKQIYSWHEKHLIVDGKTSVLGGMNIADSYMFGGLLYKNREGKISQGWRDTDLMIKGPAVRDQACAFAKNWFHLTGEKLVVEEIDLCSDETLEKEAVDVQIIQHSPSIDGDNHITTFFVAQLNRLRSGQSAIFENAYFCASSSLAVLFDAMINASKRGVNVTILTNSETSSDVPTINTAAFHVYRDLLKAGVRIFERSDSRTIHSKIAVIGDNLSVVGSANLDNRSARINSEVIAAVYSAEFADKQRNVILADMHPRVSREIKIEQLSAVPISKSAHFAAMSLLRDLC